MVFIDQKADTVGVVSSTLCLMHCIATPLIFLAQSSLLIEVNEPPTWWKFIDYFFLVISFIAVYQSTQTTSKNWIKHVLWFSWFFLFVVIINEKIAWFSFSEELIYIPAFSLIALHLYNRKYCQCNTDKCCTNER